MTITSQTNESIKEGKHYGNEGAVCLPSEQNSSVRLYRSQNFMELEERIQSTTNFFDPSRVAQNLTCRILEKETHERPSNLELFYETKMKLLRDNPGNQFSHIKIS